MKEPCLSIVNVFGRLFALFVMVFAGGCGGGSPSGPVAIPVEADSSPKHVSAVEAGYFSYSSDLTYIAYRPSLHDSVVIQDTLSGRRYFIEKQTATSFKFSKDSNRSLFFLSLVDDRSRTKLTLINIDEGNEEVIYDVQSHDIHDYCETSDQRIVLVGYDYKKNKNFVSVIALTTKVYTAELHYADISTVDDPLRVVCSFEDHPMVMSGEKILLLDPFVVLDEININGDVLLNILSDTGFIIRHQDGQASVISSDGNSIKSEIFVDKQEIIFGSDLSIKHSSHPPDIERTLSLIRNWKTRFRDALFYSGYSNDNGRLSWAETEHIKILSLLANRMPYLRDEWQFRTSYLINQGMIPKALVYGRDVVGWPASRYSIDMCCLENYVVLDAIILKEILIAINSEANMFSATDKSNALSLFNDVVRTHLLMGGGDKVIEDGFIRFPKPSNVPYDGIGIPFNQQNMLIQTILLSFNGSTDNTFSEYPSILLFYWESHITSNSEVSWPYWHDYGYRGWDEVESPSSNTLAYDGFKSKASPGYAAIDAVTAFIARNQHVASSDLINAVKAALEQTEGFKVDIIEFLGDAIRLDLLTLAELDVYSRMIDAADTRPISLAVQLLLSKDILAPANEVDESGFCGQQDSHGIPLEEISSGPKRISLSWSGQSGYMLSVCH